MKYSATLFLFISILILSIFSCERNERINNVDDILTIDSEKINRKILVVGIDGFRSDAMQESVTPFMYSLTQHSNAYYNLTHNTEGITYSGPNWSSMLTGVHMDKHNVTDNSFDGRNYDNYPSFFYYIEQASKNINTASIVNWTPINYYTLSNQADLVPLESMNDAEVFEYAKNILEDKNNVNPDILFLQFDELDGSGHSYGFHSLVPEYTNTANILDSYAQELFNIIENRRANGEDWLYFIISDHGGEGTSHSDASDPNINQTIFFAQHPELPFKASCCYVSSQVDLAPTILDFIGISSSQFELNKDGTSILE